MRHSCHEALLLRNKPVIKLFLVSFTFQNLIYLLHRQILK